MCVKPPIWASMIQPESKDMAHTARCFCGLCQISQEIIAFQDHAQYGKIAAVA